MPLNHIKIKPKQSNIRYCLQTKIFRNLCHKTKCYTHFWITNQRPYGLCQNKWLGSVTYGYKIYHVCMLGFSSYLLCLGCMCNELRGIMARSTRNPKCNHTVDYYSIKLLVRTLPATLYTSYMVSNIRSG